MLSSGSSPTVPADLAIVDVDDTQPPAAAAAVAADPYAPPAVDTADGPQPQPPAPPADTGDTAIDDDVLADSGRDDGDTATDTDNTATDGRRQAALAAARTLPPPVPADDTQPAAVDDPYSAHPTQLTLQQFKDATHDKSSLWASSTTSLQRPASSSTPAAGSQYVMFNCDDIDILRQIRSTQCRNILTTAMHCQRNGSHGHFATTEFTTDVDGTAAEASVAWQLFPIQPLTRVGGVSAVDGGAAAAAAASGEDRGGEEPAEDRGGGAARIEGGEGPAEDRGSNDGQSTRTSRRRIDRGEGPQQSSFPLEAFDLSGATTMDTSTAP